MKTIITYIKSYFDLINKKELLIISLFTAILVFINYYFGLDAIIRKNKGFAIKLSLWYIVFVIAFIVPYLVNQFFQQTSSFRNPKFIILCLIAPLVFAIKISADINFYFSSNVTQNNYWDQIIYWPLLLLITTSLLFIIHRFLDPHTTFYGIVKKGTNWKPYFILLLIMIPLIILASTQADFLSVYPKLKSISGLNDLHRFSAWQKILFELSYGSDFVTIELFFRGFLILAFIKYAGKDAILPMACFYCTIHFGKPLGECISSYFGGMILGIIVYNTRSIYGGLMVHLGIAWLMEIGGYLGNYLK